MAEEKAAPEPKAQPQQQQADVDAPEPQEPAARTYSQEEMDRITAKVRRNAARDAELRLRREAPAPAQPEKKEPPKEETEPQREDFDTYEDHQRALAGFEGRKAAREERKKEKEEETQRSTQERLTKAQQAWGAKIERAQAKHPDFEDVLEDNAATLDVLAAAPMRAFITESDIGPEIILHLVQKPDEVKRIAALPAYKQAAEIAKIEDTLAAAAKPKKEDLKEGDDEPDEELEAKEAPERDADGKFKPKETPKADEPIEPVGARPASASAEPSDKDDAATWHRKRVAQLARRRNPGR